MTTSRWSQRSGNVYVIAEAGVNHNGSLEMAHLLVEQAASAGADAVKFQTFVPDLLVTHDAQLAQYQAQRVTSANSQHDMVQALTLSPAAHAELRDHARTLGVDFLSTAFDLPSLDLLVSLGVPLLKVPSGELTNLPFLRAIGRQGLDVVVSTGMASLDEVIAALDALHAAGLAQDRATVLHCTTAYPAAMPTVNLRAMLTMRDRLGVPVGYSDHTEGIEVATAAVGMGATVIEKHLTLSRLLPGPDHAASLEPAEFAALVRAIRNVSACLGDGIKVQHADEVANAGVARRSIVAARAIRAGEVLSHENLTTKRPATGMSPMLWDRVIGTLATRDYAADEMIES